MRQRHHRQPVFQSSGPDVTIRGSARQLVDKYEALGVEAGNTIDKSLMHQYFQHAEHYKKELR